MQAGILGSHCASLNMWIFPIQRNYNYRDRLTLWLFATRLFSLFGKYVYIYIDVGNDFTSGRNNTPAAGANCSKCLLSLLWVKSPLSFLIKLFFFFQLSQVIWLSLRILHDSSGQSLESQLHSLQLRLCTERQPHLQPARAPIIPLQTHFK